MGEASANSSSGYAAQRRRLYFDGDETKYELFDIKFCGHLRLQGLHEELAKTPPQDQEVDANKNALIFAELCLVLDDKSLSLIIRDAKDDGRKALAILREHYVGKSKPRIISRPNPHNLHLHGYINLFYTLYLNNQ